MKIALMGRSLRGDMSGVVRYTFELVSALAMRRPDDVTVLVTRADDGLDGLPVRRVRAPFATRSEYSRAAWEQLVVPFEVGRLRPDVYHSPNYLVPVALRCPIVLTVHDLSFFDRSMHRTRSHLYLSALTPIGVHKADRIICVSSHTLEQFCRRFPRHADRARLVTEGVSTRFGRQPPAIVDRVRSTYHLPERYVLFVGTMEPRKNLVGLINGFERAIARTDAPHHLVLCGGGGWKNRDVFARIASSHLRDRIHVLGFVPEAHLPAMYSGASVFVYPSTNEGFGLPTVEAMACGTPVVTSDTTAMPETVAGAAYLVDPTDGDALGQGIADVLGDDGLRASLIASGLARAAALSWDRVADATLAVYQEVA